MTPLNPRTAEAEVKGLPQIGELLRARRSRHSFSKRCGAKAERLASEIAAQYGLTLAHLKGRSRKYCEPRWHAMRALYATGEYSTSEIGRLFHRDHTTVLHALGTLKHSVASDLRKAAA
jgi:chromosomal replication initiation ATPase DnaA